MTRSLDRAARDTIRQVHFSGYLYPIISLLTPEGEEVQHRSIESIDLWEPGLYSSSLSDFFSRVCLPKLRSLILHGTLMLPSWYHLARRTTRLTALSLSIDWSPQFSPPTTSQLFSILVSNPGLQALALVGPSIPAGDGDGFIRQVTLRHLSGSLCHVFRALDRLSFPRPVEFHRNHCVKLYG